MNIVYLTIAALPSRFASSVHVMKMASAFAKIGHTTTLMGYYNVPRLSKRNLYAFYGISNGFTIILFRKIPVIYRLFKEDIFTAFKKAIYLIFLKPDLVYCRDLSGAFFSVLFGFNTIIEMHSLPFNRFQTLIFKMLLKSRLLSKIVVISEALKKLFLDRFPNIKPMSRIIVAHDAVDLKQFQNASSNTDIRNMLHLDKDQHIIGYIGHLYQGRGLPIIYQLAKINPSLFFLIVGGTRLEISACRAETRLMGLNNIFFAGFIPNGTLPAYYHVCDVLLMPYERCVTIQGKGNTSSYMSPMKMFEYIASGIPFIASDLPVLREVLVDKKNCLLADPDDPDSWNNCLQKLITDDAIYKTIKAELDHIASFFTWEKRVSNIVESMENINE